MKKREVDHVLRAAGKITHDLAIAKYVAGRAKDLEFNRQLIVRGLLDRAPVRWPHLEVSAADAC